MRAILLFVLTVSISQANPNHLQVQINQLQKENKMQKEQINLLMNQIKNLMQTVENQSRAGSFAAPAQTMAASVSGDLIDQFIKKPASDIKPQAARADHIQVGAVLQYSAGYSSLRDANIGNIQQGDHDPKKRGITNRGLELSISGTVDQHWDAEAHFLYAYDHIEGETRTELEEAFFTTRQLGNNLQLEIGHMLTEFGRINPNHAHAWTFSDQPIIHGRIFGADGMRAPGLRLSWLAKSRNFHEFHVGFQNASGETMASFLANDEVYTEANPAAGRPFVGADTRNIGDLVTLLRWDQGYDLNDGKNLKLGISYLTGPNATGVGAKTDIWGVDMKFEKSWLTKSNQRRSWKLEGEYIERDFEALGVTGNGPNNAAPAAARTWGMETLEDKGFFAGVHYQRTPKLGFGLRYERAWAHGGGTFDAVSADPKRADRERISPMISWKLTEFSKIRLQYNRDEFDILPGDRRANSVWLSFDLGIGRHPSHRF